MQGTKGSKMPRGDKEQILRYEMPTFFLFRGKHWHIFFEFRQENHLNERINQNLPILDRSSKVGEVRLAA